MEDSEVRFDTVRGIDNLRKVYEQIEESLRIVAERAGAEWIPADMYYRLVTQQAMLVTVYRGEVFMGFCILSEGESETGEREMFIEAMWSSLVNFGDDMFMYGDEFLRKAAQNMGAKRIVFASARNGWERKLKKLGYRIKQYIYVKEISDGCQGQETEAH